VIDKDRDEAFGVLIAAEQIANLGETGPTGSGDVNRWRAPVVRRVIKTQKSIG
jgi:hypothetical protein